MPLVTARGFQLTPDLLGSFSRGSQAVGQFRTQQLQEKILQDQLQQQQAAQQQAAQRQAMLGQIFGGQQQSIPGATPPISGATPPISPVDGFGTGARAQPQAAGGLMPPQPAAPRGTGMASDQALAEFAARFPDQFEQVNKNLGLIDSRRKSEAARRAFEIEQAPVEQRPELINAQAQALRAQGRDPSDTLSLLNLPPEQQNAALKTVQIAALPNEKRLDLAQGKTASIKAGVDAEGPGFFAVTPTGAQRIPGASPEPKAGDADGVSEVQSSKILPGGLVQFVRKDGTVEVVEPEQANIELIETAERRGAELQGLRAGERGEAKEATKAAAAAFKALGAARKNIANMDEGIKLLEEGAKSGAVEGRLPSVRAASVKLDNLRNRLGLDVIGGTTFGALSESELNFALSTALPSGLDEKELLSWMREKRQAQNKLTTNLEEAALFLGTPGNTVKDFIQMKKQERDAREAAQGAESPIQSEQLQDVPIEQLQAEAARLRGQ